MSLIIHTSYDTEIKYNDVEYLFSSIGVVDDLDKVFVKEIELGTLSDIRWYIDRFGYKLSTRFLSTGTKGCICVNHVKDGVISLKELGRNAQIAIIKYVKSGEVWLPFFGYEIPGDDCKIDVVYFGKHASTLGELNAIIEEG